MARELAVLAITLLVACRSGEAQRSATGDRNSAPVRDAPAPALDASTDASTADAPAPPPHYKIHFPAPSQVRQTSVATTAGQMSQQVEVAELGGTTFLVVSGSQPPGLPVGNHAGAQDRVLAMFSANATRDVAIKLGDLDGREVLFSGAASGILHTFAIDTWVLQAGVVVRTGTLDERKARSFLDSLQIQR